MKDKTKFMPKMNPSERLRFPWKMLLEHPYYIAGSPSQTLALFNSTLKYWQMDCPERIQITQNLCGLGREGYTRIKCELEKDLTIFLCEIRQHYISELERIKMIVDRTRTAVESRKKNKGYKNQNNKENSRFSDLTSEKQEISIHAPTAGARMTHHIAKSTGAFSD